MSPDGDAIIGVPIEATPTPPPPEPPLRTLLTDLIEGVSDLVRQELRLAQAETSEKLTRIGGGVIAIAGGLVMATCALLVLLQALVLALSDYMDPALASLVVGGIVALIAIISIWRGKKTLSAESLAPKRTIRSLRDDTEMVMEKTR